MSAQDPRYPDNPYDPENPNSPAHPSNPYHNLYKRQQLIQSSFKNLTHTQANMAQIIEKKHKNIYKSGEVEFTDRFTHLLVENQQNIFPSMQQGVATDTQSVSPAQAVATPPQPYQAVVESPPATEDSVVPESNSGDNEQISPEEITKLFGGDSPSEAEASTSAESATEEATPGDDGGQLSQDEIAKLFGGGDDATPEAESAPVENTVDQGYSGASDDGGQLSQDEIAKLFGGGDTSEVESPSSSVEATPSATAGDDGGQLSQDEIAKLFGGGDAEPETESAPPTDTAELASAGDSGDGGQLSQDEIAKLFGGGDMASENSPPLISESVESSPSPEVITHKEEELNQQKATLDELQASLEEQQQSLAHEREELVTKRAELESERELIEQKAQELQKAEKEHSVALEVARNDAAKIIADAKEEVENIRKKAHALGFSQGEADGFSQGESDGLSEGRLEFNSLIREVQLVIDEMKDARFGLLVSSEKQIIELALGIASRVVREEVASKPKLLFNNLRESFRRISDEEKIVVRLNIKDKSLVEHHKRELIGSLRSLERAEIVEDNLIQPGGCLVETNLGSIDGTISTQMDVLEAELMGYLNDQQAIKKELAESAENESSGRGIEPGPATNTAANQSPAQLPPNLSTGDSGDGNKQNLSTELDVTSNPHVTDGTSSGLMNEEAGLSEAGAAVIAESRDGIINDG